jgi:hypothetical protein
MRSSLKIAADVRKFRADVEVFCGPEGISKPAGVICGAAAG